LENRLIELELQLVNQRGELAAFERRYLKTVGLRYAELDEIEAQIAELLARREPENPGAQGTAREARTRAQESHTSAANLAVHSTGRFSPSSSLKSLYREVARRIHPDLAVDETDRTKRQSLMAEANRAYENGDEARLRAILEEYESSPEAVFGEGTAVELVRVIRKIAQVKRRLAEIQSETDQIRASDLFELKKKVDEGTKQGRDILNEMATAIQSQIAQRQAELRDTRERGKK
jgi:DnaJ-domain-containing protein 1